MVPPLVHCPLFQVKADDTLHYAHAAWTSSTLLDGADGGDATTKKNAKYPAFNDVKVGSLRLDNMDRGTHSVVQPASSTDRSVLSLLELMQRSTTTALTYRSGQPTPFMLATDSSATSCGNAWSINGVGNYAFWQRIGGTFASNWDCSYGTDSNGAKTGAESAGFGLLDSQWGPFLNAKRGFGTRQAHDYDGVLGGGQLAANGALWVGR